MSMKKNFKQPKEYWFSIFCFVSLVAAAIWFFYLFSGVSEERIVEIFGNQKLTGSSSHRGVIGIERFLANRFGKAGIMAVPVVAMLIGIVKLRKEILEYVRYARKNRLYKQGLVSDLYDDYKPLPFFKALTSFFKRKEGAKKVSYPSKKEMKEALKRNKYFKEK